MALAGMTNGVKNSTTIRRDKAKQIGCVIGYVGRLTGVCQADLVDFVRVKPDLAFSAFEDRCGQPLLELKGNHFCVKQRSEIATTISVRNVYCELIMGEAHSSIESARCGYSVHGMMLSRSSNPRPNLDA